MVRRQEEISDRIRRNIQTNNIDKMAIYISCKIVYSNP